MSHLIELDTTGKLKLWVDKKILKQIFSRKNSIIFCCRTCSYCVLEGDLGFHSLPVRSVQTWVMDQLIQHAVMSVFAAMIVSSILIICMFYFNQPFISGCHDTMVIIDNLQKFKCYWCCSIWTNEVLKLNILPILSHPNNK